MTRDELHQLLSDEHRRLMRTLGRIDRLRAQLGGSPPSEHEITAFGAYLHDLYGGLENL